MIHLPVLCRRADAEAYACPDQFGVDGGRRIGGKLGRCTKRFAVVLTVAVAALPLLGAGHAKAYGGWYGGAYVGARVYVPPPVVYGPPPAYYAPPIVYAPPPPVRWIAGHYNWRGFWVPGHWMP